MLERITLRGFKSFHDAEIDLGRLTLIVGANASGKSNLRDALRFLHGVGQGYALAEVIGEKYGPGGVLVWRGIRGGAREVATHGATQLSIGCTIRRGDEELSTYDLTVDVADIKTGRASSESAWGDGTPSPWPTTGTPTPKTIPSSSGASTRSGCGTQEETTTASTGRSRPWFESTGARANGRARG